MIQPTRLVRIISVNLCQPLLLLHITRIRQALNTWISGDRRVVIGIGSDSDIGIRVGCRIGE